MDAGLLELVSKILLAVSFIAIGGAAAIIFFFIFAPSLLSSRAMHHQLDQLIRQTELMNEQLKKIAGSLKNSKDPDEEQT